MGNNYIKAAKFYSLTSNSTVSISGASFLHGIYNSHNNAISVTVDDAYTICIAQNNSVTFPTPVVFTGIKIGNSSSATILYS
jgi:hypothetical protein